MRLVDFSRCCTFALPLLLAGCAPDRIDRARLVGDTLARKSIEGRSADLAGITSLPDVVRVGESLAGVLVGLRDELVSGYSVEAQEGERLEGDSSVTHTVVVRSGRHELFVRLRYDSERDRFHIVGFSNRALSRPSARPAGP